jgi:mevalonate kinase
MIYARGGWQRDGTAKNKQAKQAIQQNIQQFLTEIGQMAKEAEQTETDQSLKQLANQIGTLSTQIKFNDQTQGQL